MRIARLLLVIRILSMGFFIGSVVLAVWQQQVEWYVMVACVSMGIYLLACMGSPPIGTTSTAIHTIVRDE